MYWTFSVAQDIALLMSFKRDTVRRAFDLIGPSPVSQIAIDDT